MWLILTGSSATLLGIPKVLRAALKPRERGKSLDYPDSLSQHNTLTRHSDQSINCDWDDDELDGFFKKKKGLSLVKNADKLINWRVQTHHLWFTVYIHIARVV